MSEEPNPAVALALAHVRQACGEQETDNIQADITINFHPDLGIAGTTIIELIARDGYYRSQFETSISSGGLTAYRGGARWDWESRIFGGAYDAGPHTIRPKYGALNHRADPLGGSWRFGSSHFRLAPHVRSRTSFCYPDSYWQPLDFAVNGVSRVVELANANALKLDPLDDYIEAHVHGTLKIEDDVEALVLDPSFKGTSIEEAARALPCQVEWHSGFSLRLDHLAACEAYRGSATAQAIVKIANNNSISPATLWGARDSLLDYQTAKWVWHCIARFGRD